MPLLYSSAVPIPRPKEKSEIGTFLFCLCFKAYNPRPGSTA